MFTNTHTYILVGFREREVNVLGAGNLLLSSLAPMCRVSWSVARTVDLDTKEC